MNGIMQLADPRWLDYHRSRSSRDLVVYYGSLNKRTAREPFDPCFCVLKGTPPRSIVAVGNVRAQLDLGEDDAWKKYGPALGADTEAGWREQARAVLENSRKTNGGKLLAIELVDFCEYDAPVTLSDVNYVGEKAWQNTKELDADTTRKLLALLEKEGDARPLPSVTDAVATGDEEVSALEGMAKERTVLTRGRSARLRKEALRRARGVCEVCRTDFSRILDGRGTRVLQVHHKHQIALAEVPRVTLLEDLAVVCANCHSLIHLNLRHAMLIDDLRNMLERVPRPEPSS